MKKPLLFLLFALFAGSLSAQTEIVLNLQHQFGNSDFVMDDPYTTTAGYDLKIERLEYYLSELVIIHDGGQQTAVSNTWLLVRADEDTAFSLGSYNVQSIEGLNFSVGVNYDVNHADPSTYPADHPLAPQNPSCTGAGMRVIVLRR